METVEVPGFVSNKILTALRESVKVNIKDILFWKVQIYDDIWK